MTWHNSAKNIKSQTVQTTNDRTLLAATYNCPCVKTGWFNKIPILSNVCPWDLFTVIANSGIIGNSVLWRLNGKIDPEHVQFIRGIKIFLLRAVPVKTSQLHFDVCINFMRILVPLINASFVFKFLNSKTMQSTFNINLCGVKPLIVKEFKNSTG